MVAALGGILFSSPEAKRTEARSEAMYHGLKKQQEEMVALIDSLRFPKPSLGSAAWHTAQHLRALSGVMIEETGDWKALYQVHDVQK